MNITRFILKQQTGQLVIEQGKNQAQLSFEYLRVIPPLLANNANVISNKKAVQLYNIEQLGKHGHRFIFDDGFSCIFNPLDFEQLIEHHDSYWQQYLSALNEKKMSREAKIDIVNLS